MPHETTAQPPPQPKALPLSRSEAAIAEIGRLLVGVARLDQVARRSPNLAAIMDQHARVTPQRTVPTPPREYGRVITNADMDGAA
jgi:hypothetical protein